MQWKPNVIKTLTQENIKLCLFIYSYFNTKYKYLESVGGQKKKL